MSSIRMSANSREVIGAISTITGKQEYLRSTNGALTIAGSFSLTGQAIPASGLTTAVAVQIVDGSGNQISSFGGGTQYTDGGVPPAHPIGNTIEWSDGANWQTVSTAKPLPVTASFSPSGTQDVNVKQISGTAASVNNGTVDAGTQRVTIASDSTGLVKLATGANAIGSITNTTFGATQATAANLNATVIGAGSAGTANAGVVTIQGIASMTKLLVTPDSVALPANQSVNVSQINAVTPLMGNGVTGTGSQRVTIASDNTAFSVNATLSAETTKVIGTVNQGTSPWVVSNSVLSVVGNGAAATAQRVTLANDSTGIIATVGAVTAITNALPAGSNVIGHVITDTGSTTAVTGTVTVSGTVSITANSAVNVAQINGVTPLMGNGVTGTGSQRVTIASDNTAFSVNATLSAETTKVIGVVRNADGSGNLLTSTSNALDINLKTSSITLPVSLTSTTITGSVTVAQATAANLNATVVQGTAAALGSPWPTYNGEISDFTGTFTNATQTTSVTATGLDGYGNILISIQGTYGTATAVFEGSDDSGTTWFAVDAAQTSGNTIEGGYTSLTNVTRSWQVNVPGFDSVRVRSTAVASGTVNVRMSASAALGADAAAVSIGSSLPSGTAALGSVNLSPTSSGGWTGYALGGANAALTTTQTVSAAAGKFGGYMTLINLNSAPAYIQVFDTTGAVTLGTTPPTYIIAIPANSTAANGVGANMELSNGLIISNGIKIAATTTSNGSSTVATGVTGTILYH